MLPNVLPVEDKEVSDALQKSFTKQGIDCRTSTKVDNIEVKDESVVLSMAKGEDTQHRKWNPTLQLEWFPILMVCFPLI